MSGIDKITARLQEDCEKQCKEIETAAVADAERIIAEAVAKAEKDTAALKRETDDKADLILDKAKSSAALESRQAILKAKVNLIEDVIEKAQNKLHNLDAPSYFSMLTLLAKKNKEAGEGIMFLCKRDLDRLPADFESGLEDISVSKVPCNIEDGFILKYGDIEINCTFSALVAAEMDELKSIASELLFN